MTLQAEFEALADEKDFSGVVKVPLGDRPIAELTCGLDERLAVLAAA